MIRICKALTEAKTVPKPIFTKKQIKGFQILRQFEHITVKKNINRIKRKPGFKFAENTHTLLAEC